MVWGFVESCECTGFQGTLSLFIHLTHDDVVDTCENEKKNETQKTPQTLRLNEVMFVELKTILLISGT